MTKKILAGARLEVSAISIKRALEIDDAALAALVAGRQRISRQQCFALEQLTRRSVGQLALAAVVRAADPKKARSNAAAIAATDELLSKFKLLRDDVPSLRLQAKSRRRVG